MFYPLCVFLQLLRKCIVRQRTLAVSAGKSAVSVSAGVPSRASGPTS